MSAENKTLRLNKVARELNVGISTIVEYLNKKGKKVEASPNAKISNELYEILLKAFPHDREIKAVSDNIVKVRPADAVVIRAEDVLAKQKENDEDYVDDREVFIKTNTIDFKPGQSERETAKSKKKTKEKMISESEVEQTKPPLLQQAGCRKHGHHLRRCQHLPKHTCQSRPRRNSPWRPQDSPADCPLQLHKGRVSAHRNIWAER